MLIRKTRHSFLTLPIATGQSVGAGKAVSIINGEVHLADKDTNKIAHGFCKTVDGNNAIIQVNGKLYVDYAINQVPYWLSSAGGLSSNPPSTGSAQPIAIGVSGSELLITIDNTVILL